MADAPRRRMTNATSTSQLGLALDGQTAEDRNPGEGSTADGSLGGASGDAQRLHIPQQRSGALAGPPDPSMAELTLLVVTRTI